MGWGKWLAVTAQGTVQFTDIIVEISDLFRTGYKNVSHRKADTHRLDCLLDTVLYVHYQVHSHDTWAKYHFYPK